MCLQKEYCSKDRGFSIAYKQDFGDFRRKMEFSWWFSAILHTSQLKKKKLYNELENSVESLKSERLYVFRQETTPFTVTWTVNSILSYGPIVNTAQLPIFHCDYHNENPRILALSLPAQIKRRKYSAVRYNCITLHTQRTCSNNTIWLC